MWYVAEDCLVHVPIEGHIDEVKQFLDYRLCMQGSTPVRMVFQDAPVWKDDLQQYTLAHLCLPQDYLFHDEKKGNLSYTNQAGDTRQFRIFALLWTFTTPAIARALLVGWPLTGVEDHFVSWALTEMRKVLEERAGMLRTRYEHDLL